MDRTLLTLVSLLALVGASCPGVVRAYDSPDRHPAGRLSVIARPVRSYAGEETALIVRVKTVHAISNLAIRMDGLGRWQIINAPRNSCSDDQIPGVLRTGKRHSVAWEFGNEGAAPFRCTIGISMKATGPGPYTLILEAYADVTRTGLLLARNRLSKGSVRVHGTIAPCSSRCW